MPSKETTNMTIRRTVAVMIIALIAGVCLNAQVGLAQGPQTDTTIDAATRTAVIEGAIKNLNEAYVFPEVAKKMEQALRERVAKQEYDAVSNARSLAEKLTADL